MNLREWGDIYRGTLFTKLYLSHERCARSGWRPILIEFSFFRVTRTNRAEEKAGVSERGAALRQGGRIKREREREKIEKGIATHTRDTSEMEFLSLFSIIV